MLILTRSNNGKVCFSSVQLYFYNCPAVTWFLNFSPCFPPFSHTSLHTLIDSQLLFAYSPGLNWENYFFKIYFLELLHLPSALGLEPPPRNMPLSWLLPWLQLSFMISLFPFFPLPPTLFYCFNLFSWIPFCYLSLLSARISLNMELMLYSKGTENKKKEPRAWNFWKFCWSGTLRCKYQRQINSQGSASGRSYPFQNLSSEQYWIFNEFREFGFGWPHSHHLGTS